MAQEVQKELTNELLEKLKKFDLVFLSTLFEGEKPFVNAISWVYAPSSGKVRFAVDSKSQIISNIRKNGNVVLTVFQGDSVYSINGAGKLVIDEIEGIPFKLSMVEIDVEEVHDVMFYGSKIITTPQYEKTYNKEAAEKLDLQVLEALKTK